MTRQCIDADGGADVTASVPEDLDEEIGGSIDDRGRVGKAVNGIDVAVDGDDGGNRIQRAGLAQDDGKLGQGTGAGGSVAVFYGAIGSSGPGNDAVSVGGDYTAQVKHRTHSLRGEVISACRRRRRKRETKVGEALRYLRWVRHKILMG